MMLIGNLALTGVGIPYLGIGLAGFYSKDAIINATYGGHGGMASYAFILLVVAAGMTRFYSWRQSLTSSPGRYRGVDPQHLPHPPHHAHAEPMAGHDDNAHDDHGHEHHAPRLD